MIAIDHLARVLAKELNGEVSDIIPFAHRTAHEMYRAVWQQADGATPILIRFYGGIRCDEEAQTEATALRDLYRLGYPVPDLYLFVEDSALLGRPLIVMQYLPGESLGKVALADSARIPYWLDQASNLLLRLHGLRWQDTFNTMQPALSPAEFADRQVKWWGREARNLKADETADGFAWLRANLYCTRRAHNLALVHRDFHPNNLLVDGNKISGVLDWGECSIADPAVDVAWSRMILATEVSPDLGNTFTASYQRRNPEIKGSLPFWEVFSACKRLTVMAALRQKSVDKRSGNPDSSPEHELPPIDDNVAQATCEFLQQRLTNED